VIEPGGRRVLNIDAAEKSWGNRTYFKFGLGLGSEFSGGRRSSTRRPFPPPSRGSTTFGRRNARTPRSAVRQHDLRALRVLPTGRSERGGCSSSAPSAEFRAGRTLDLCRGGLPPRSPSRATTLEPRGAVNLDVGADLGKYGEVKARIGYVAGIARASLDTGRRRCASPLRVRVRIECAHCAADRRPA
jgi:hypothetical protein